MDPVQTVLHSIVWTLSDGKNKIPTEQNVIFTSTLGDQSVVGLNVPNTNNHPYAGNVDQKSLESLANSLPSASSTLFPYLT